MNVKKMQLFGALLGLVLVMGATSGNAVTLAQGGGNVTVATDELTVKITGGGNVPMYQFWDTEDDSTKYKLQFSAVFEAEDNEENGTLGVYDLGEDKKVGPTNIALASLSWEFSDFENDTDGSIHFNLTSTATNDGMTIQFNNHLYAGEENSMKFDVVINNYTFDSVDTILVFAFKLLVQNGDEDVDGESEQDGDTVSFGDGFFQSEETAVSDGKVVNVGLSTGSDEGSKIYLAYGQFSGDLVHDPTVGVQASAVIPDDTTTGGDGPNLADASDETFISWDERISREDAGLTTFFASFIAVVVPVSLYRRR
ncbi:MAG: hypothetical protein ACXAE3_02855 [Candidatus Kariarchaeaceae archaeon]|jgi:hypothetical protein